MKTIAAGKFKDVCLKTLDDVARTKAPVIITKRGRPVAKLVAVGPQVSRLVSPEACWANTETRWHWRKVESILKSGRSGKRIIPRKRPRLTFARR